jgi:hypothetical protein
VRRDGGAAGVATVAGGWWTEPKEAEPFGEEDGQRWLEEIINDHNHEVPSEEEETELTMKEQDMEWRDRTTLPKGKISRAPSGLCASVLPH